MINLLPGPNVAQLLVSFTPACDCYELFSFLNQRYLIWFSSGDGLLNEL